MDRPLVMGIIVATLLVSGCATQPVAFVPPGVDRDELLGTIAKNGQGGGVVEPVAPSKPDRLTTILVGGAEVTGKVAVICLALAVGFGYAMCKGAGGLGGESTSCNGTPDWLRQLWPDG
jgi:hypothetical protein